MQIVSNCFKRVIRTGTEKGEPQTHLRCSPSSRTASLHTDLHEEVGWRKDPKTDGKKGPTFHPAPLVPVLHQLFADLTINFIPAAGKHEKKTHQPPTENNSGYPGAVFRSCLMSFLDSAYPAIRWSFSRGESERSGLGPSPINTFSSPLKSSNW